MNTNMDMKKVKYGFFFLFVSLMGLVHSQNVGNGFISVNSNIGTIQVFVDSVYIGKTPIKRHELKAGKHSIQISTTECIVDSKYIMVVEGMEHPFNIDIHPTLATLTVNTEKHTEIWVDSKKKGVGTWSGNINEGLHIVEGRQANKVRLKKKIELEAGKGDTVYLDCPTPAFGTLLISSVPDSATVSIDNSKWGITPLYTDSIIVGRHKISLRKEGYTPEYQHVNIDIKKPKHLHVDMNKGNDSIELLSMTFEMFIGAGYEFIGNRSVYADVGFVANRHLFQFEYLYGLEDLGVCFYDAETNHQMGFVDYRMQSYTLRYGYQIPVMSEFSIVPMVGFGIMNIKGDEYQLTQLNNIGKGRKTAALAKLACRLSYRYKFFQINLLPEYSLKIDGGVVFNEVKSVRDIKDFSLRIGVDFIFD